MTGLMRTRTRAMVQPMGHISDLRQAQQVFERLGPVIHLRDADTCGVARTVLLRMTDRGELLRLAKSSFVEAERYNSSNIWGQFGQRSIAFALCIAQDAHLTGPAAAHLLGLPVLGDPPLLPTAIRPGNPHIGHDRTPFGRLRRGYLPLFHRTVRARVRTVDPVFAAVDIARHLGPLDGLLAADAALHDGAGRWKMQELAGHMLGYPGISTVQWVAQNATERAESPLESLGRYSFLTAGWPAPLSNVWIPTGRQWFRVDHLIPETGVIVEADGAVKYNNRPDADAIVTSQRVREQLLRGLGFGIARYNWNDAVSRPWIIPARAKEAAAQRPAVPVPTCWTLDDPRGSTR